MQTGCSKLLSQQGLGTGSAANTSLRSSCWPHVCDGVVESIPSSTSYPSHIFQSSYGPPSWDEQAAEEPWLCPEGSRLFWLWMQCENAEESPSVDEKVGLLALILLSQPPDPVSLHTSSVTHTQHRHHGGQHDDGC